MIVPWFVTLSVIGLWFVTLLVVGLWLFLLKYSGSWKNVTVDRTGLWFVILMVIGQRFVKLIGCWFIYRLLPRRALKVTMSSKSTPYLPVHICTWYLWCKSANSWTRCYFLTTIPIFWSYPIFTACSLWYLSSPDLKFFLPEITRFDAFQPATFTTFPL